MLTLTHTLKHGRAYRQPDAYTQTGDVYADGGLQTEALHTHKQTSFAARLCVGTLAGYEV